MIKSECSQEIIGLVEMIIVQCTVSNDLIVDGINFEISCFKLGLDGFKDFINLLSLEVMT